MGRSSGFLCCIHLPLLKNCSTNNLSLHKVFANNQFLVISWTFAGLPHLQHPIVRFRVHLFKGDVADAFFVVIFKYPVQKLPYDFVRPAPFFDRLNMLQQLAG